MSSHLRTSACRDEQRRLELEAIEAQEELEEHQANSAPLAPTPNHPPEHHEQAIHVAGEVTVTRNVVSANGAKTASSIGSPNAKRDVMVMGLPGSAVAEAVVMDGQHTNKMGSKRFFGLF